MPRLQVSRRSSLLSTKFRDVFLQSFNRNATAKQLDLTLADRARVSNILTIARRVQADVKQVTGRYYPIHQVVASIHDLKRITSQKSTERDSSTPTSTPHPLRIVITSTTPPSSVTDNIIPPSMSRRRIVHNKPTLHCQLPLSSLSPATSPVCESPSILTPTSAFPLIPWATHSSCDSYPVTPVEQILHTPPSPPRMPRVFPVPPRTWAQRNVQARRGDNSPLIESPNLSLTPYMLSINPTGKPFLGRLYIPDVYSPMVGDTELKGRHLSPTPSPQTVSPVLSPLDLGKASRAMPPPFVLETRRPKPMRTNSSSSLTRTALLRAGAGRRFSLNQGEQMVSPLSPLSPFAAPQSLASPLGLFAGQALASPFLFRSETIRGDYFHL